MFITRQKSEDKFDYFCSYKNLKPHVRKITDGKLQVLADRRKILDKVCFFSGE